MIRAISIAASLLLASPAFAAGHGDPAKGESGFMKCRACHTVADGDNVIFKGGRAGPNLFGVIGRQAGTFEGYRYGQSMVAAGEAGLVWTQENLVEYLKDPKAFLRNFLDDSSARTRMNFRLNRGGEDIAAWLASVGPAPNTDGTN